MNNGEYQKPKVVSMGVSDFFGFGAFLLVRYGPPNISTLEQEQASRKSVGEMIEAPKACFSKTF
ncbi:hypothetical protein LAG90_14240 [Marinilongibacter aquaticus]|uniref:hypothetical protein n=1 Tax=Marinilongibacter aquaticus TaxID=2975157 RepID=UPI0021BD1F85|nr:hypothetical protein [Marinilongibacter aquaticus]UBM57965.1 hypothetical protein LAG90_14240 [Marinilongibacter aquaticus]